MSEARPLTLGQCVRERRKLIGISLRELAGQVGVSAPYLSDIERDQRWPSPKVMTKLAEKLNANRAMLMDYDPALELAHLQRLLRTTPGLLQALRSTLRQIQTGKLAPEKLTRQLTAATGNRRGRNG